MPADMRLNKYIAELGICSRRKADELISAGEVKIHGTTVTDLGTKVDPTHHEISVKSVVYPPRDATLKPKNVYIALNKPIDVISSASNEQGTSVLDLITPDTYYKQRYKADVARLEGVRLFPVGRLDKDSEGLIILTNDGSLTNELTHPKYEHEKEYEVTIDAALTKDAAALLKKGMFIENEFYGGMQIKKEFNKGKRVILTVVLTEGKNRHIRKMLGALGYHISVLRRIRMGKLVLGTLSIGTWKFVDRDSLV